MIDFLITGTGRCGTGWAAKVLESAGVPCGHEAVFTPNGRLNPTKPGESSWLAGAFLDHPWLRNAQIVHLVRDPVAVINSMIRNQWFDCIAGGAYYWYILKHLPKVKQYRHFECQAAYFFLEWNRRIEYRPDVIRHRVEDGAAALLAKLNIDHKGSLYDNTDYNHRPGPVPWDFRYLNLPAELRLPLKQMARRYGYKG